MSEENKITIGKIDASCLKINKHGDFDAKVICDFCGAKGLRLENDVKEIEGKNFCKKCYNKIFKK